MDDNFKFFALAYLNGWWQYDRNFVLGLSPSRDRNGRASRLSEAATYYDIIRRFPEGSMPQVLDLSMRHSGRWVSSEHTMSIWL